MQGAPKPADAAAGVAEALSAVQGGHGAYRHPYLLCLYGLSGVCTSCRGLPSQSMLLLELLRPCRLCKGGRGAYRKL